MVQFIKENKKYYDADTIQKILCVARSNVQRELKKYSTTRIKYKNLYLYTELTLFEILEKTLIEKLEKQNDRF
jgi:hypothetical protein